MGSEDAMELMAALQSSLARVAISVRLTLSPWQVLDVRRLDRRSASPGWVM